MAVAIASRMVESLCASRAVGRRRAARRPGREILLEDPSARARARDAAEVDARFGRELARHGGCAHLRCGAVPALPLPPRMRERQSPRCWAGAHPPEPCRAVPTTVPDSDVTSRLPLAGAAAQGRPRRGRRAVLMRATISPTCTTWPFTMGSSTTSPPRGRASPSRPCPSPRWPGSRPGFTCCPGGDLQLDDGPFGEAFPDVGKMELVQRRFTAHSASTFRASASTCSVVMR